MEILVGIVVVLGLIFIPYFFRKLTVYLGKVVVPPIRAIVSKLEDSQNFEKKLANCRLKIEKTNWQEIENDLNKIKSEVKLLQSIPANYDRKVKIDPTQIESKTSLSTYLNKPINFHNFLKNSEND